MGGMCGQDEERFYNQESETAGQVNVRPKEGGTIRTQGSREIFDRQPPPPSPGDPYLNIWENQKHRSGIHQNPNKQMPLSIGQQALKKYPKTFPGDRQSATMGSNYNDQMNPAMELFNRQKAINRMNQESHKPPPGSGGVDPLAKLYRGGIEDAPPPREQGFVDSYNHPLSKYVEPFSDFMGKMQGFDMDTEQGRYEFWKASQASEDAYQKGQDERKRDQDRASMQTNIQGVGTPLDPCPSGWVYNEESKTCVEVEGEETSDDVYTRNTQSMDQFLGGAPITEYGRVGTESPGEYTWFTKNMRDGGMARAPQGAISGQGGPKDDLVGPVMLSNTEYVLPNEQVKLYGGGNYNTGLMRLEKDRKNALKKYN